MNLDMTEDQERQQLLAVIDVWIALLEMEIRNTTPRPAPPTLRPSERYMAADWLERKAS